MNDLFQQAETKRVKSAPNKTARSGKNSPSGGDYSAKDIEVLEGLEPVRRRPGMYIGGTDDPALHHLAAEVMDNSMDEAVAGHASRITIELAADGSLSIEDNGRGVPTDPHPKFKNKSALEVILTTLHSGGKFSDKVYHTAGGLHGVGISVVNALSEWLEIEVARDKQLWRQRFSRGHATTKLKSAGPVNNRRGTKVSFLPDSKIFGAGLKFRPAALYRMARSKAYLYGGVEIRWLCDAALITGKDSTPIEEKLHFPNGIEDFLQLQIEGEPTVTPKPFVGHVSLNGKGGRVEWALAWTGGGGAFLNSYCNTVPTPEGGTHEAGLRAALTKGLKAYGEMVKTKGAGQINADDILGPAGAVLSIFIGDPQFQGQTKEKLSSASATKLVESVVRDHFDHWLSGDPAAADKLLAFVIERAEERLKRKQDKEVSRKSATRRLRLPGKLADCSRSGAEGTELFIVEGDSAGGSAKQARDRKTQAILPLRGKILNVATAGADKLRANQELSDLGQALGCGTRERYDTKDLRYDRVIIMTDADVDGAHIASLLMTYFYREMPGLIADGHLYLAVPPLYRLTQGGKTEYARDDAHREALMAGEFSGRGKVEVSRFKGLGEMPPKQLRDTTMNPAKRTLLRVVVPEAKRQATDKRIEHLMGKKPELRLAFIQEHAADISELDI